MSFKWIRFNVNGAGAGNVTGPGSSTDNAVARYDGVTGKIIQNSPVTIGDLGEIDGAASISFMSGDLPDDALVYIAEHDDNDLHLNVGPDGITQVTFDGISFYDFNDTRLAIRSPITGRAELHFHDSSDVLTFSMARASDAGAFRLQNFSDTEFLIENQGDRSLTISTVASKEIIMNGVFFLGKPASQQDARLRLRGQTVGGKTILALNTSLDSIRWQVTYDDTADTVTVLVNLAPYLLDATAGAELRSGDGPVEITSSTAADAVLKLENSADSVVSTTFLTDEDPNGVITGAGGDVAIRDEAALSKLYLNQAATTGTVWNEVAVNPPNVIQISNSAEFEALATAGVITISSDTTLELKTAIATASRFVVETGATLHIVAGVRAGISLVYVGAATFFTVSGTLRIQQGTAVISGSTGTFLDMTDGGTFNFTQGALINWDDFGSFVDSDLFILREMTVVGYGVGFTVTNAVGIVLTNVGFVNPDATTPFLSIDGNQTTFTLEGIGVSGVDNTEALLRIDPGISEASRILLNTVTYSSTGDIFDTAGGSTGVFTAVTDEEIVSETITSVTDSGGVARFNHSGDDTYVNQEVVNANFVTNTAYNGTFLITAAGSGFFEVASIPFGSNEASVGDFSSETVEFTETGTTLGDGDTIVIDTTLSADYDGGGTVYNQTTNAFRLNRDFVATEEGTWSTAGVNQTDPRVLANQVVNFEDSHYIATGFVSGNIEPNGAIVTDTYTDMVFGNAGDALISGSTIERWKLVDEVNGTFEYTGNEPFDGSMSFDFTVESSGGTVGFLFKIVHDIGSGFVDLPDLVVVLADVGGDAQSVTKTFPLRAVKGDMIKPQVTRVGGSGVITASYVTFYAQM